MNKNVSNCLTAFLNNQSEFNNGDDTDNGLYLADIYIPEEILFHIISFIEPKEILKYSLVCHRWNNLIKSYTLWATIYSRKYRQKPKNLPWYVYYCLLSTNYFDTNLLLNGNGQDHFNSWEIKENSGHEWIIENPPIGADALPIDLPEFNNKISCFVTSCNICYKKQQIKLGQSKLFQYILDNYKPHIYLCEWATGRSDSGCIYRLGCEFIGKSLRQELLTKPWVEHRVYYGEGGHWKKIEMTITEYPEGVESITFEHEGCNAQLRGGHYGTKMAGGVIKLLFDSIGQLPVDEFGKEMHKQFRRINFITNARTVKEQLHEGFVELFYPCYTAPKKCRRCKHRY